MRAPSPNPSAMRTTDATADEEIERDVAYDSDWSTPDHYDELDLDSDGPRSPILSPLVGWPRWKGASGDAKVGYQSGGSTSVLYDELNLDSDGPRSPILSPLLGWPTCKGVSGVAMPLDAAGDLIVPVHKRRNPFPEDDVHHSKSRLKSGSRKALSGNAELYKGTASPRSPLLLPDIVRTRFPGFWFLIICYKRYRHIPDCDLAPELLVFRKALKLALRNLGIELPPRPPAVAVEQF
ncbi:hypothetical protein BDZ88DRAFT_433513 [Geranomyces variabilis]|nr:hypothetical protein BDZ88DRAFT_433513 [Geranomyces variabilis]KAJ3131323.1 hypothetical protein HDU90_008595 [Geranomyces variabilis]